MQVGLSGLSEGPNSRVKYWILHHICTSDSENRDSLTNYACMDREWNKICHILNLYKENLFMRDLSSLEFDLSFSRFDESIVHKICLPCSNNKIHFGKSSILCIEPSLPPDFIESFLMAFMQIDQPIKTAQFKSLHISIHTSLHKIWLQAAKLEIRPQKSGIAESSVENYDFSCKCPKNYMSDTYIFKNHKANVSLNIKIYYSSRLHKLSVRFIKLDFYEIPSLYMRKRPRRLPFDILFDITSFLPRSDLDNCQLTCREMLLFIENHKNFALHEISTAKLVTKGNFYCFGVFVEGNDSVKDFRERRSNLTVNQNLFYPLLRNSSIDQFHIKRIDFGVVFDHFKAGITQCVPLSIRRIVFSAGDSDYLGRILELTERLLHIKEYQIEVFSRDLMQKLLIEPVIKRCDKFIVYEQYHDNRSILDHLFRFLTSAPRPNCKFILRNGMAEELVNVFLDQIVENFIHTKDIMAFNYSVLLVLHANPVRVPRLFKLPTQQNINNAFEYEMPTLSNIYQFVNHHNRQHWLTICLGVTMFFPIQRVCYIEFGKITY